MAAEKPPFFSVMISERGPDQWFVYDTSRSGRIGIYFGSSDDCWQIADALNAREQRREEAARPDWIAELNAELDRAHQARMHGWMERIEKQAELGVANEICLNALSLPA